ncbi:uncharacterized protein LOC111696325 [Eurytemora carolleeae]|uniref:uncharacterized protein LOC111696325 n=1 Tax=Eurytemora carolleeae TaxID=1294199 RepID=UPI000C75FB40|nr:uncharacterized protein LOC111696325 [Eurytemora carolleeae]|eukprot:XP_023321668.1 uncharacterized protein LOC111696325 [Eurytemora affinis]
MIYRSKLCQVFSPSSPRWGCRLVSWRNLVDPTLGYLDASGGATVNIILDIDPCLTTRLITAEDLADANEITLLPLCNQFKKIVIPKNFSLSKLYDQVTSDCEKIVARDQNSEMSVPGRVWVFNNNHLSLRALDITLKSTIFQLEEYFLGDILYIYVETKILKHQDISNMPGSPELEEKDTLLFIREKLGIRLFF